MQDKHLNLGTITLFLSGFFSTLLRPLGQVYMPLKKVERIVPTIWGDPEPCTVGIWEPQDINQEIESPREETWLSHTAKKGQHCGLRLLSGLEKRPSV